MLNNLPPVTKNIILLNVILFGSVIVLKTMGIEISQYLSMHFYLSESFMPHQILTHMFMHAGMFHILMNMFIFFMFGPHLEKRMGSKKFLTFYLLTGFGAVILHYISIYLEEFTFIQDTAQIKNAYSRQALVEYINIYATELTSLGDSNVNNIVQELWKVKDQINAGAQLSDEAVYNITDVIISVKVPSMVGASGAVFGVLAGFAIFFPNVELLLFFVLPVKAKYVVLGYAALELYLGFQNDPNDHIAHFAHLGGALFGYLIIREWRQKGLI